MRFQALMPDVLHWLGIQKIDNMVSMSDMYVLPVLFFSFLFRRTTGYSGNPTTHALFRWNVPFPYHVCPILGKMLHHSSLGYLVMILSL